MVQWVQSKIKGTMNSTGDVSGTTSDFNRSLARWCDTHGGNNTITVIVSGPATELKAHLDEWLRAKGLRDEEIQTKAYEDSAGMIRCRVAPAVIEQLHVAFQKVSGPEELDFIDVVFPQALFPGETVIGGPAYKRQKDMINELAPFTATPGKRKDLLAPAPQATD